MTRPSEQAYARAVFREVGRLERLAAAESRRLGWHLQRAVHNARRCGQCAIRKTRQQFESMRDSLREAMLAAHLTGLRRNALSVGKEAEIEFATAYETAVDFLTRRLALSPAALAALREEFDTRAATILNQTSAEVERKLGAALARVTELGLTARQADQQIRQAFTAAGLTPQNSFTVEAVYRTQTQLAYGAGRWQADQSPAVQEILWGYRYSTVGDSRVRDTHAALDGVTLTKDDPFWAANWPPNGWACRCVAIPVFEEREQVRPPAEVNGRPLAPDPGFAFNPGQVYGVAAGVTG